MIAAILGGEILGVVGMIFAIPLTAVIYTLLRDMSMEKEAKKIAISVESTSDLSKELLAEKNPLYGRATGIYKMKEMGFDLLSEEDKTNRFGYYERHFYFGW